MHREFPPIEAALPEGAILRSVILATYQGERFIDAQLESILSQLAADDEIVLSDDASSDHTLAIVRKRNDPRIRVLENHERLGYVKNFERALLSARGTYVIFSDQDDVWLPNKLTAVTSALSRADCVVSDAIVVDKDLREIYSSYFAFRKATRFSFVSVLLRPCFIGATMACTRSYLNDLLPFPPHVPHDFWITLNAVWDRKIEVILNPLILYRRHSTSASVSATCVRRPTKTILLERLRMLVHLLFHRIRRQRQK